MKDQQSSLFNHPRRPGARLLGKLYKNPTSYVALVIVSYALLLVVSYSFGFLAGSSFRRRVISMFVISKTVPNSRYADVSMSSELMTATRCANPIPPELVRKTVIDRVYSGTSPYEEFISQAISRPLAKRGESGISYEAVYKSLVHKLRPKTIIKLSTSSVSSATYMSNLTTRVGLETQILCFDSSHGWPGDLFEGIEKENVDAKDIVEHFMQRVISQNATEYILPVPISQDMALEKLCEWGIVGDLIEVDAGRDFNSAWSIINRAYTLLRPGGVLFGHNHFSSGVQQAVELFATVHNFRFKADRQHWIIDSF